MSAVIRDDPLLQSIIVVAQALRILNPEPSLPMAEKPPSPGKSAFASGFTGPGEAQRPLGGKRN